MCDSCRKGGLEKKRNCGFLPPRENEGKAIVWMHGRVSLKTCPKSFVTAQSIAWLEEFYAWKLFGEHDFHRLPARTVEAFCVLEAELAEERANVDR